MAKASEYVPAEFRYFDRKTQYFGGNVKDSKGRKIGVIVTTETREVTARAEGAEGYHVAKPENFGVMYGVRVQKSKDGEKWGAGQAMKWFRTEDEAKEHWVRKVTNRIADNWK